MKLFQMFVLFALFAASAYAYDVAIKVTVSQDTLAVGTNVTIAKDGVLLYNAKAGLDGFALFSLDAGSYFVYLDRGGYSRHVNLLEVNGTTNITYTMRQTISSASAYGQISGPSSFDGASVAAYSAGKIVKRVVPNKDGYYTMFYIPEGNYDVVFSVPGYVEKTEPASLPMSQFTEVDARLEKIVVAPVEAPAMSAPAFVKQQSVIEIALVSNGLPLAGKVVAVKTPAGDIVVTTGADGKARVNAVKSGAYVFTYGNLTMKTVVEGEAVVPVQKPDEPVPTVPVPNEQPSQGNWLVAGAIMLAMVAVIAIIGAVLLIASKTGRKKHADAAKAAPREDEHRREELPPHPHEKYMPPHERTLLEKKRRRK